MQTYCWNSLKVLTRLIGFQYFTVCIIEMQQKKPGVESLFNVLWSIRCSCVLLVWVWLRLSDIQYIFVGINNGFITKWHTWSWTWWKSTALNAQAFVPVLLVFKSPPASGIAFTRLWIGLVVELMSSNFFSNYILMCNSVVVVSWGQDVWSWYQLEGSL